MTAHSLISVIVPVYNGASYLPACIESLLAQDYPAVQVVIVDDGSSDDSAAMVDNYHTAYPDKIKVHHIAHGGLARARNVGLDIADGSLIAFCDADDALAPYALSYLAGALWQFPECDMAMGQLCEGKSLEVLPESAEPHFEKTDTISALKATLYQQPLFHCSMGAKLFRRDIFNSERFTDGLYYEDLEITPRLYMKMREIAVTATPFYFYRCNPESTISTWSEKRFHATQAADMVLETVVAHHTYLYGAAQNRRFSAYYNIFVLAWKHSDRKRAIELWPVVRDLRKTILLDKKARAKNRLGALISFAGPDVTAFIVNILYRIKPSH